MQLPFESESLRGSHHYYFPLWQLASPWWTLSNGLFSLVCSDPWFHCTFLTFPSAPLWCPCRGTLTRWLWISYHWGSSCCWTGPSLRGIERQWTENVTHLHKKHLCNMFFVVVQKCSQFSMPASDNMCWQLFSTKVMTKWEIVAVHLFLYQ